jgi:hypothetical protein
MSYVRARYLQMAQTILCNRRHTIKAGCDRLLLKPCLPGALLSTMQAAVRSRRPRAAKAGVLEHVRTRRRLA